MPSEVRLTRAQKRDLLRMSGAAVVSTVFFAVPMFSTRPSVARPETRVPIMMPNVMPGAVAVGKPDTHLPVSALDTVSLDTVSVVTSTEVAAVSTPVLRPSAPAPRRRPAVEPVQARARPTAPAATPLGRRLARIIAGDGRYGVRPFPSVGTSGS